MFRLPWLRNWVHVAHSRKERRRLAVRNRRILQRPRLFLESLEDRTLMATWTALGPAPISNGQTNGNLPVSGRVTGLATDPEDANTIYIATAGGGIWKTSDATNASPTWTPLTDNVTDSNGNPLPLFMGAVAETVDSNNNDIVYAGMGEANNSGDSYYGEGILVSKDGGATWTQTTGPNNAFIRNTVAKIAIDPGDTTGGTALAALSDRSVNGLPGRTGIWETQDFGATWTNVTGAVGLSTTDSWSDVVIDPHTPNIVYAAQGNPQGAAGNGVYKSTDGGKSWTLLDGSGSFNGRQDGRITLALYDDGTTNELFEAISVPETGGQSEESDGPTSGLFKLLKSTDGGNTFQDLTKNPGVTNYMDGQGSYNTTLIVDPNNANYLYAGGSQNGGGAGNIESFDGGNNWVDITSDLVGNGPHSDDHAVAFDTNGNLIDGNDGGVYKLSNPTNQANQRWTSLNANLNTIQFNGLGVAIDTVTQNLILYGGAQDNGTSKYTGSTAWRLLQGGDGGISRVDPNNPAIVYQEFFAISLQVSTDAGQNFTDITNGIKANKDGNNRPIVQFYAPYTLDASGSVYFGTDYLNVSSNQGGTWSQIGTPGVNGFNPIDAPIDAIAVNPVVTSNVVYVSAGGHMFVTRNAQAGGSNVTWTQIDLPNKSRAGATNSLAIDPSDATGGTAYAVVNSFTGGGSHVFKTTNFGATWADISGSLPDTPVSSVAVSPDGKTVYAGTDVGVYSASSRGGTWTPFGTGLPNVEVRDLQYVAAKNLLVAGTYGRGAWSVATNPIPPTPAPVVTTNPISQTVTAGQTAIFTAAATGSPVPDVRWQISTDGGKTFTFINGATSPTLTLGNVQSSQNGYQYRAVFTNTVDTAATSAATLTVNAPVPPAPPPAVAASIQFTNISVTPNPFALTATETINVNVSQGGGSVSFAVGGQNVTASVDANGNATVTVTVPLLNVVFPQGITAAFNGVNATANASITARWFALIDSTKDIVWNLFLTAIDKVQADGTQVVTFYFNGSPLLFIAWTSSGQLKGFGMGTG
jgi:hypothetical protein